jgi:DNA invertase Pin-like site-specific DNA recombinase
MIDARRQIVADLRTAYSASGLTYSQIAKRASCSENTVYRALNYGPINLATLLRLCTVLKREVRISPAA